jgi:hypothetical protein
MAPQQPEARGFSGEDEDEDEDEDEEEENQPEEGIASETDLDAV